MERVGWKKGYSEKYNIDYQYISGFMGGVTCEFCYHDKRYGFTARPVVDLGAKKTFDMETNEEALDRELDNIMNYLILSERELKEPKRVDEINSKNSILFTISEEAECYFVKFNASNKDINECLDAYVHDGMTSTYFIIRINDFHDVLLNEKEKNLYFAYNPYFRTLDFEDFNDAGYDLYVKNVGKENMLFKAHLGVMLIRPGETVKYCKKNIYKREITCPTCYGRDITNEKE